MKGVGGLGIDPFFRNCSQLFCFCNSDVRSIDFSPRIKKYINKDLISILITIIIIIFTSQLPTMSLGRVA